MIYVNRVACHVIYHNFSCTTHTCIFGTFLKTAIQMNDVNIFYFHVLKTTNRFSHFTPESYISSFQFQYASFQ